ncbi:hypothetical protein CU098_006774 [Rhizopus stolonifer]|uniref:PROP1-like PPR domain-containing protein n=1 Tax=Rhizopus stolonifer TaxID=4846 RepID=A0A367KX48_RHIST|nr:hypothetical protein CU098_006774 [Rhizopus stolonifer]
MRKSMTHLKDVSRLISTPEHNGGTCQRRNSHLQALLEAFQSSQRGPFIVSNASIPRRKRSSLISKIYKTNYSTTTRPTLQPPPPVVQWPRSLNVLNLTDKLTLSDLDRAVSAQQADKAWTLFVTLSGRGDNIPLITCCSLYALLVFAKSMLCRGTMIETRQRQMDKLLDYVQHNHQHTAGLFLPSVQHIVLPLRKKVARLIRFEEIEKAWTLFFRAHKEGKEKIPRNMCIKLIQLMFKDKHLTRNQLTHRVRTIALHGAGKIDTGDRTVLASDVLRMAYIYEHYQTKKRDVAYELIDKFVAGIPKKKLKNRADALEELVWGILINNDLPKALEVINKIRERYAEKVEINETIYINLMEACRKQKEYHQALKLFENFLESNRQPSLNGFNTILRIFASQKVPDRALYIFGVMLKLKVEPDAITYTEMIRSYAHDDDYDKCLLFYNKMLENNQTPNIYTYSALMEASAYRHDMYSVLRWFQTMISNHIEPNNVIISLVLRSLSRQKSINVPKISQVIMREASMAGVKPDAVLYTTLLKLQTERLGLESVLNINKDMIAHSVKPNTHTCTALIDACVNITNQVQQPIQLS